MNICQIKIFLSSVGSVVTISHMERWLHGRAVAVAIGVIILLCASVASAADQSAPPDEAKRLGLTAQYFVPRPGQYHDYFHGMDAVSVPINGGPDTAWPDQLLDSQPMNNDGSRPTTRPARRLDDAQLTTDSEILGRNTWMLWCGGNEQFWGEYLPQNGHGFLELLKVIDTRNRTIRWRDVGMVNEPGMRQATRSCEVSLSA